MKLSCKAIDLGHRYQHKYLFRSLSFEVGAGQLLLIKGSNGAGKSTLLKILSGAMEPVEGRAFFQADGAEIADDILWQKIGLVAPYQELPEELSLMELIDFQCALVPAAATKDHYLTTAGRFGMTGHLHKPVREYSTGMRQKSRIILSLTPGRIIWLMDEPTSNLDPGSHQVFWNMVLAEKEHKLLVVATNDPAEIAFGDFVVEMV